MFNTKNHKREKTAKKYKTPIIPILEKKKKKNTNPYQIVVSGAPFAPAEANTFSFVSIRLKFMSATNKLNRNTKGKQKSTQRENPKEYNNEIILFFLATKEDFPFKKHNNKQCSQKKKSSSYKNDKMASKGNEH